MEPKHKKMIKELLSWYGSAAVIEQMHDQMVEDSKDYSEEAIILQNIPVVAECKEKLLELRLKRLLEGISVLAKTAQDITMPKIKAEGGKKTCYKCDRVLLAGEDLMCNHCKREYNASTQCQAFILCGKPATTTLNNVVIGDVPCCEGCKKLLS